MYRYGPYPTTHRMPQHYQRTMGQAPTTSQAMSDAAKAAIALVPIGAVTYAGFRLGSVDKKKLPSYLGYAIGGVGALSLGLALLTALGIMPPKA